MKKVKPYSNNTIIRPRVLRIRQATYELNSLVVQSSRLTGVLTEEPNLGNDLLTYVVSARDGNG